MSISSSVNRSHYSGNGSTTVFATGFPFFDAADILVVLKNTSGVESVLTLTTHYTVSGGGGSTGSVTMLTAPASGESLVIINNRAPLQQIEFSDNDQIPADSIEEGLDKQSRITSRARDLGERAVRLPDTTVLSTFDPKLPTSMTADQVLAVNDTGNGFKMGPTTAELEQWKDDAENAAIAAASSANSASSSASAASGSASAASGFAQDAEAARDLALQYRNEAEGFKDDAEAAALSAVTTIGPVGSSPNANGGTIATNTLTLQPASSSHPGVMTTGTQTIAGSKAWTGRQLFTDLVDMGADASNVTQTGDDQTIPAEQMTRVVLRTTAATLNSIAGFNGTDVDWLRFHIFFNASSTDKVLRNESGSASATHRIITGTGADVTVAPGASVLLVRDVGSSRWRVVGGAGGGSSTVFGSTGTPRSVVAATGITAGAAHMSPSVTDQIIFLEGDTGGEEDISANPQIQAHTIVGSKMRLYGVSDADFIKLETGTGLLLNGDWYSYAGAVLDLMWNGSVWAETGRNR